MKNISRWWTPCSPRSSGSRNKRDSRQECFPRPAVSLRVPPPQPAIRPAAPPAGEPRRYTALLACMLPPIGGSGEQREPIGGLHLPHHGHCHAGENLSFPPTREPYDGERAPNAFPLSGRWHDEVVTDEVGLLTPYQSASQTAFRPSLCRLRRHLPPPEGVFPKGGSLFYPSRLSVRVGLAPPAPYHCRSEKSCRGL